MEAAGFKKAVRKDVNVEVSTAATIDFALAYRREPQGPLAQRFAQLAVAVATGQEPLPDSAEDAAGK